MSGFGSVLTLSHSYNMGWFQFWALKCRKTLQTSKKVLICSHLPLWHWCLFIICGAEMTFFFPLRVLSACCFSFLSLSAEWICSVLFSARQSAWSFCWFITLLSSYFSSDNLTIVHANWVFVWRCLRTSQFCLILISGCQDVIVNQFVPITYHYRFPPFWKNASVN